MTFQPGDKVWVRTEHIGMPSVVTRKLAPKYMGPYAVKRVINPVAFEVALPASFAIHNVFHAS